MNNIIWKIFGKLRLSNNLISKRFICVNAIYNIKYVEPRHNYVITSQRFVDNFQIRKTLLNLINNWTSYRNYSKKKKPVHTQEDDEESESEGAADEHDDDDHNMLSKTVPSLRLDSILKAGLGVTKKKVEKEFYASNIRVNGEKMMKKSFTLQKGDEIDLVNGVSSENPKLLSVHRVCIKSIGKITGAATYPVRLQVFKSLLVENYQDTWASSRNESE